MYTGRCLCGGITFRISEELAPITVCHCHQCRRAQGGPVGTNIPVSAANFELSRLHSKVDPGASEMKVKVGVRSRVLPRIPEVIVVSGGWVPTVKARVAGVGSTLPAGSIARTAKV